MKFSFFENEKRDEAKLAFEVEEKPSAKKNASKNNNGF